MKKWILCICALSICSFIFFGYNVPHGQAVVEEYQVHRQEVDAVVKEQVGMYEQYRLLGYNGQEQWIVDIGGQLYLVDVTNKQVENVKLNN